jgi:peptidyl-prolyl cis-trans isomerase SurA
MYKYILILLMLIVTNYATAHSLDRIVAVVNDDIITERQIINETKKLRIQLRQQRASIPSENKLHEQALDQLIDKTLQLQLAKSAGLEVKDVFLDQAINDIAKRNQITVAALKQKLAAEGIDFSDYRQDLREQIMLSQIQQRELAPNITVTNEEVKQISHKIKPLATGATRYHVIDILIPIADKAAIEKAKIAQTKAQNLLAKLEKGADFCHLAMVEAERSHLPNGGDFGWQGLNQLPELFAQKVQQMTKGQIAGPIRAGNGLHIIKLQDIREAGALPHYAKQTHIRHILIKTDKLTNDEIAKMRLLQLKEKLMRGANFAEIAKANSQDNLTHIKGGELGWISEGMLDPNFEQLMNHLKVGEIGGPVKSHFGWHLLQVLGRRQIEDSKALLSNQVRSLAYQQKMQQSLPAWLQQLRNSAYVKKY